MARCVVSAPAGEALGPLLTDVADGLYHGFAGEQSQNCVSCLTYG